MMDILLLDIDGTLLHPGGYRQGVTAVGAFLGGAIGFSLERRLVRFRGDGPVWQRGLRYVVGIVSILPLSLGLGTVARMLCDEPGLLEGSLRLVRYTLIGLWLGLGAPWLFVKLRLARAEG